MVRLLQLGSPKKNVKIWSFETEENETGKMEEARGADLADLSAIPGTYMLEEENQLSHNQLWPSHKRPSPEHPSPPT